jgi:hypothetical protein
MMIQQVKLTHNVQEPNMMFGSMFGSGVALSADGEYALVGGTAAWIFSRRFGSWAEEAWFPTIPCFGYGLAFLSHAQSGFIGDGSAVHVMKHSGSWAESAALHSSGAPGWSSFGSSVAISHDRSTLLVGARSDAGSKGTAWVFVRDESGVWIEQKKLIGFNETGGARFGWSVALSADGNTALVGGPQDNDQRGAVWTFTRDADFWHPLNKLVLPPDMRDQNFGLGVALSANGDRALISDYRGVRTFLRTLTGWQQDGDKLSLGSVGSVALSADGTMALIGDPLADGAVGAAWLWLLAGTFYKLTATDEIGLGYFGQQVALTPDGNTALIGGWGDDGGRGAAWLFINPLAVTRLTPPSGPASGGTTVKISGTGFSGASYVRFGSNPATSFTVDGATQITAISPPGQPGMVEVRVTTSVATSATTPADKFTYV